MHTHATTMSGGYSRREPAR